jgi:hypothetical protein
LPALDPNYVTLNGRQQPKIAGGSQPIAPPPGGFRVEDLSWSNVLIDAAIVQINWQPAGNGLNPYLVDNLPSFYSDLAQSSYLNSLHGPYGGAGSSVSYFGAVSVNDPIPGTLHDAAIKSMLIAHIANGTLPIDFSNAGIPHTNYVYVVHIPPSYGAPTDNKGNACDGNPGTGWCAYHSYDTAHFFPPYDGETGTYFSYVVIPDLEAGNACSKFCGFTGAGFLNETTKAASHEVIETLTDPWGTGVNYIKGADGNSDWEIGDACNGNNSNGSFPVTVENGSGFTTMAASNGPPWLVQAPWENGQCVLAPFGWNSNAYKSSGFIVDRGPYHYDAFSTDPNTRAVAAAWWDMTGFGGAGAAPSGPQNSTNWFSYALGPNGLALPGTPVAVDSRYPPATVPTTDSTGHLDIFLSGPSGKLQSAYWGPWSSFFTPPYGTWTKPGSNVAVLSRAPIMLDVIFCDNSGNLQDVIHSDANGLWSYRSITQNAPFAPGCNVTAVSRYPSHIDAFAVDRSGNLWNYYYDDGPATWGAWNLTASLGGPVLAPGAQVAAIGRSPNNLDVFSTDLNGTVQSYWWNSANGWGFVRGGVISGAAPGAPVAVDDQWQGHIDVFTTARNPSDPVGSTGELITGFWDDVQPTWNGHQSVVPGSVWTFGPGWGLQAISRMRETLDVFGLAPDGTMWGTSITWQDPLFSNGTGGAWTTPFQVNSVQSAYGCASGVASDVFQANGQTMVGCGGQVTWSNAYQLCGYYAHVCSVAEYNARRSGVQPSNDYWVQDALLYENDGTDYSGHCVVTDTPGYNSCGWTDPSYMRVCTMRNGGTDYFGNQCTWVGCGFNTYTNEYFGGCGNTAGTLCCQ